MQKLSDSEFGVLRIIWNLEEQDISPCLKDIVVEYNARYRKKDLPLAPQTISTFLVRLTKKGYLTHQHKGRSIFHQSTISPADYQKLFLYDTLELFFGEKVDAAMEALKEI